jgi:hypothetical protein
MKKKFIFFFKAARGAVLFFFFVLIQRRSKKNQGLAFRRPASDWSAKIRRTRCAQTARIS